jgi:membrane protease YdiL (CAAX protease family)
MLSLKKHIFKAANSMLVLLVFSTAMIYFAMLAPYIYGKFFGNFDASQTPTFVFFIVYSLLCFFVIPAAAYKFILKKNLRDIGLRLPSGKAKTFFLILIALLILVPSIYGLTKQAGFRHYYTLAHPTIGKLVEMAIFFPIYYFGEEFFFRGFLFLSLWQKVRWHSEIFFTLSHIGKPGLEILLCIPASVVFNCLTLYTKSFYPAIIVHSCIGIFALYIINSHYIIL